MPQSDPETYAVIGAAMEVHRELGHGFLESVYHEAMRRELGMRGIPFENERLIRLTYKGQPMDAYFKADLVCFNEIVVELKSLSAGTGGPEQAQLLHYLRATGLKRGLLINFGQPSLEYRRFVL